MRFKLFYDEANQTLKVNCLNDNSNDIKQPSNPKEHVFFPLPIEHKTKIKMDLRDLIPDDYNDEIRSIDKEIQRLRVLRTSRLDEMRLDMNCKIMDYCRQFRMDHAELFV